MKNATNYLLAMLLCCLLPMIAQAQTEKRYPDWRDLPEDQPSFYYSNPAKILPDARLAFKEDNYARTLMLCSMHYIVYGDESKETKEKDQLRTQAEKCYDYAREMKALLEAEDIPEAKKRATELLKLNPGDKAAQKVLKLKDPVEEQPAVVVPPKPVETEPVPVKEPDKEPEKDPVEEVVTTPLAPVKESRKLSNAFYVQAGAGLYGGSVAPEAALGLYGLGGSSFGIGAGVFGVVDSVGLFGAELIPSVQIARGLMVSPCIGFFADGSGTKGLCGGAGVSYMIGNHFLVSVKGRYFPAVKYYGTKQVSTSGTSYEFPSVEIGRKAAFVPSVSVGWAF